MGRVISAISDIFREVWNFLRTFLIRLLRVPLMITDFLLFEIREALNGEVLKDIRIVHLVSALLAVIITAGLVLLEKNLLAETLRALFEIENRSFDIFGLTVMLEDLFAYSFIFLETLIIMMLLDLLEITHHFHFGLRRRARIIFAAFMTILLLLMSGINISIGVWRVEQVQILADVDSKSSDDFFLAGAGIESDNDNIAGGSPEENNYTQWVHYGLATLSVVIPLVVGLALSATIEIIIFSVIKYVLAFLAFPFLIMRAITFSLINFLEPAQYGPPYPGGQQNPEMVEVRGSTIPASQSLTTFRSETPLPGPSEASLDTDANKTREDLKHIREVIYIDEL